MRGLTGVLMVIALPACLAVTHPAPETISYRAPEQGPPTRSVAVIAPEADVRLLSLLGRHDTDVERSHAATQAWLSAVAELALRRPGYKPVDGSRWDAATQQDWLAAQAVIRRWLTALLEGRLEPQSRAFGWDGAAHDNPPGLPVYRRVTGGGMTLGAALPSLAAPDAALSVLDLDWPRWRRQLDADHLLVLFSSDTRATPDRVVGGVVAGAVAGAVAGVGACAGWAEGENRKDLAYMLGCSLIWAPIGVVSGVVAVPQRMSGEHQFAAAMLDLKTGQLEYSVRALVATDSDDAVEDARLLMLLIP